jgi:hypothetical protein
MAKRFTAAEKESAEVALRDAKQTVGVTETTVSAAVRGPDGNYEVAVPLIKDLQDANGRIAGALADLGGKPCGGGRPC